ncbi:hypothetical protein CA603_07455 [Paraburkholderia hospita]|nr:hypothetical protein CA603_07455 [Paraburkholderia hospita]
MFHALVHAQSEAALNWIALWQEMWARAAAARDPVGLVALPFLTLPEFASQGTLYSKRLFDITAPYYASSAKASGTAAASPTTTDAPDSSTAVSGLDLPVAAARYRGPANQTIKRSISPAQFRGE